MNKVIRFTASWCQPCKALASIMEGIDSNVPIEVVDIDIHPDVAAEYGVRSVPTLILLDENIQMNRIIGTKTVNQLQEWVQ